VETASAEAQGIKYNVPTSADHEFIPALVRFSAEPTRIFKISLTSNQQYHSRTKDIQKDDEDVVVALLMALGKD